MMTEQTWRSWGHLAVERGPRCPDDERLRQAVEQDAGEDGGEVRDHLASCWRCRLEAGELRSFLAAVHEPSPDALEITHALRRMLPTLPDGEHGRGAVVLPHRPRPRRWGVAWALAAAGLLVAGLVALQVRQRPAVPSLESGPGVLRGEQRPELLQPHGEQPTVPRIFSWGGQGSGPWEVRLEQTDGVLLWSTTTTTSEVRLPETVVAELRPGLRYWWQVRDVQPGATPVRASFHISLPR